MVVLLSGIDGEGAKLPVLSSVDHVLDLEHHGVSDYSRWSMHV
jgi:hypothetical protein